MSLTEVAKITNAQRHGKDVEFYGVSTDSRTIAKGELFVALTGENFNGHEFISTSCENGAVAVLVSEDIDIQVPNIKVKDTLTGLQQLAASWRNRFVIPLVGITGSNGKTTVKELVGEILKVAYADVLITQGNLNNHIGVPLTLLKLNAEHQIAVVEMGMNHAGEISTLTKMSRPTVALVNNAMLAHVEAFDNVEEVAQAKGEIFDGLADDGIAVLNADDDNYSLWKKLIGNREYIDFGLDCSAAVTAIVNYESDCLHLEIKTPKSEFDCRLNLLGKHNAMNALAATAVASALGIDSKIIKQGLENVYPVQGRLQPIKLNNDVLLLNDSYNANPDSMKAGIDVLAQLKGKKKILVAGDMAELGQAAPHLHEEIGHYAKAKEIDCFLSFGCLMSSAADAYGESGLNTEIMSELLARLTEEITVSSVILVKGSRSMRMERVVKHLEENHAGGQS